MNKTFQKTIALSLMALVAAAGLLTAPAWAAPKAEPVDGVYEFLPVPEGQHLTHTFVVKNTGDTDLSILSVIPP